MISFGLVLSTTFHNSFCSNIAYMSSAYLNYFLKPLIFSYLLSCFSSMIMMVERLLFAQLAGIYIKSHNLIKIGFYFTKYISF